MEPEAEKPEVGGGIFFFDYDDEEKRKRWLHKPPRLHSIRVTRIVRRTLI